MTARELEAACLELTLQRLAPLERLRQAFAALGEEPVALGDRLLPRRELLVARADRGGARGERLVPLRDHAIPLANEREAGDGSTTWRQNFECWWRMWQDDLFPFDMGWIRSVHPGATTLEQWMRERKYEGTLRGDVLKNAEDAKAVSLNFERMAQL